MSTTTRLYISSDAGAPVLTGQTGTLIALLQAVLVGTAGVAYGAGPTAKPSAGWTQPFTPTATKCVFRNSAAAGGTGVYVRVLDDGSGAAGFKEAFFTSYAAMSSIDVGTNPTPTTVQMATGVPVRKSSAESGTARAWTIVADELTCWIRIDADPATLGEKGLYGFGDFQDFVAASTYRFFSMGRFLYDNSVGACGSLIAQFNDASTPTDASHQGLWLASGISLSGTAIPAAIAGLFMPNQQAFAGTLAQIADPAPGSSGRFYIPGMLLNENTIRGVLRGFYVPLNNLAAVASGTIDTSPIGQPIGSALVILSAEQGSGATARIAIESALAWPL